VIGTHFHRGTITMVCLEGSVRYLEYDWVARPAG
jgi:2,4'-dihydroxyacetophenone dioxygenase